MNEIEEYLLMIFLESIDCLNLYKQLMCGENINIFKFDILNIAADKWNKFKREELGRTLPEEFEFYLSDYGFSCVKLGGGNVGLCKSKDLRHINKIKITVVEE